MGRLLLTALLASVLSTMSPAQEERADSTDLGEIFKSVLGLAQPKVGLDAQFGAMASNTGGAYLSRDFTSRFYVNLLRVFLAGNPDGRFSYLVQADLNAGFSLLDLKFSYDISDNFRIDAGQFKAPFGREYLADDADLTFIDRSAAANFITLGRQQGVQLAARTDRNDLQVVAGIFNGDAYSYVSGKKISLFAGQIYYVPLDDRRAFSGVRIDVGGSAALTTDASDLGRFNYWDAHKLLYSSNFRIDYDRLWLMGEYDYVALMDRRVLLAHGLTADAGYRIGRRWEVAGRFDWYQRNDLDGYDFFTGLRYITRNYLFGINWYPEQNIRLKLDYVRDQVNNFNSGYLIFQYAINHGK